MKVIKDKLYWWGADLFKALKDSNDQLVGQRVASFSKIFGKAPTYHNPIPIISKYVQAFRPIPSDYNVDKYLRFLVKSVFLEGK
jgi:hypothetical protein